MGKQTTVTRGREARSTSPNPSTAPGANTGQDARWRVADGGGFDRRLARGRASTSFPIRWSGSAAVSGSLGSFGISAALSGIDRVVSFRAATASVVEEVRTRFGTGIRQQLRLGKCRALKRAARDLAEAAVWHLFLIDGRDGSAVPIGDFLTRKRRCGYSAARRSQRFAPSRSGEAGRDAAARAQGSSPPASRFHRAGAANGSRREKPRSLGALRFSTWSPPGQRRLSVVAAAANRLQLIEGFSWATRFPSRRLGVGDVFLGVLDLPLAITSAFSSSTGIACSAGMVRPAGEGVGNRRARRSW